MSRIYDYPLVSWIGAGLHRDTLERVVETVKRDQPLEDILPQRAGNAAYINKILREEVLKQFSNRDRPMVEVILNAVDAKPSGLQDDYYIRINVGWRKFTTIDNGTGMTLDQILRLLIIPFNTEKTGIDEIGRFGVGFLSCLNYCLENPKNSVGLTTRTGKESYNLIFYADGDNVHDLRLALGPSWRHYPAGTGVQIRRRIIGKRNLLYYIWNQVKGIPAYRARIRINGEAVNDDCDEPWYAQPVELELRGKKVTQEVGLRLEQSIAKGELGIIHLTSQGVCVRRLTNITGYDTTVSFPAGVQLVEGRDEFKKDINYQHCVNATFKAMEQYVRDWQKEWQEEKSRDTKNDKKQKRAKDKAEDKVKDNAEDQELQCLLAIIPSLMAAFEIKSIKDIPNIDTLREVLLPQKKYVLTLQELEHFTPFFGKERLEEVGFHAEYGAHSYWHELYDSGNQLIKNALTIRETLNQVEFYEKVKLDTSFYPNLHLVARELSWMKKMIFNYICLGEPSLQLPIPAGPSPYLCHQQSLYINIRHPLVSEALDPTKVYALTTEYFALPLVQANRQQWNQGKESLENEVQQLICEKLFPEQYRQKKLEQQNPII